MASIGSTIGKYVAVLPALQSMVNFMQSVIKQFEIFSTVLGSEVDIGELQIPRTDLVTTQTTPRSMEQQLQADNEGQKMFNYITNLWQGEAWGASSNFTGIGTGVETQQLSQALGLAGLGSKEFSSIFNTAPNIMQKVDYIGTYLESLVLIGTQGKITADIIKRATGETNPKVGQMPTEWGQIWSEATNKALMVLQPLPDSLTKYQREVTATLLNGATALSNTKNETLVDMAQRQVELNTLSAPQISAGLSLPRVGNYGEPIVEGVADTPEGLGASDEDLKYIRGVAQREAIINYTTAQIAVDFKNTATINSDLDIDVVMNKFTEKLREAVDTCAEGVNYCV